MPAGEITVLYILPLRFLTEKKQEGTRF